VNYIFVTKFLDEPPKVLDRALRCSGAVLFEEFVEAGVIEDLVADV